MGVVTAVLGIQQQKQSQKEAKKANEAANQQRNAEAARARKQQIRQARIKAGQIQNAGATSGTQGSSSVVGAASSLQAQLGSNLGFLNTSIANQNTEFRHRQKSEDFAGNAANLQALSDLSFKAAGAAAGAV